MKIESCGFWVIINEMEFEGYCEVEVEIGDLGVPGSPSTEDVVGVRMKYPVSVDGVEMSKEELLGFLGPVQLEILRATAEESVE